MAFTLPTFNVMANVWHDGNAITNPPDFVTACQLYLNTRGLLDLTPGDDGQYVPPVWMRVPMGTDLRLLDTVECEPTSGMFYHVRWTERVHLGFPNEYFVGLVEQLTSAPPSPGSILLESGDAVLLESGDLILLE